MSSKYSSIIKSVVRNTAISQKVLENYCRGSMLSSYEDNQINKLRHNSLIMSNNISENDIKHTLKHMIYYPKKIN